LQGLSEEECWDHRVHVFFQQKAWADSNLCGRYSKEVLAPSMAVLPVAQGRKVGCDNLKGQRDWHGDFQLFNKKHAGADTICTPDQLTHLTAPVDAGFGALLKAKIESMQSAFIERSGEQH